MDRFVAVGERPDEPETLNNRAPPLVPFSFFNYDPVKEGTGQLARDGIFLSLLDNLYDNRRGNRIDEYFCFVELFMELSSDENFFPPWKSATR